MKTYSNLLNDGYLICFIWNQTIYLRNNLSFIKILKFELYKLTMNKKWIGKKVNKKLVKILKNAEINSPTNKLCFKK